VIRSRKKRKTAAERLSVLKISQRREGETEDEEGREEDEEEEEEEVRRKPE
jgi:hypothetical protein